jgi:hypothetical protein
MGRDRFGHLDVDGRIILKLFVELGCENLYLIQLAQHRVHQRVLVDTVMNVRTP